MNVRTVAYQLDRLRDALIDAEAYSEVGEAVERLRHPFVVKIGDQWLYEGFVSFLSAGRRALSAIDPSISPSLPPILLEPETIARFFGIPAQELNRRKHPNKVGASVSHRVSPSTACENLEHLPKEVSTAVAAKILGVSKDTVLKLKDSGLLPYRNMAPPTSSRPVYAFPYESILELRLSYQRDEPPPRRHTRQSRQRTQHTGTYKHLSLLD